MKEFSIDPRRILLGLVVLSPFLILLAGGITMCCLYRPGERIGPVGYWIVSIMLADSFFIVLAALLGRPPDTEAGEADEPESEARWPLP
jgi:hypothetical protein